MNRIKHSKTKNTGLLFELLIRQITSDITRGVESPGMNIMKRYFQKTELSKEYRLYESIFNGNFDDKELALYTLNEVLNSSKKLNKKELSRQKYNLIKELKNHYDIDVFFNAKVNNYKGLASLYVLLEDATNPKISDPKYISKNKQTLLESIIGVNPHITPEENILKELEEDKDLRILTSKILFEKFNEKYSGLNPHQKMVLKEFIELMGSNHGMIKMYNAHIKNIKSSLNENINKVEDKVTNIKLKGIIDLLEEKERSYKITDDNMVDLLQFYELKYELNNVITESLNIDGQEVKFGTVSKNGQHGLYYYKDGGGEIGRVMLDPEEYELYLNSRYEGRKIIALKHFKDAKKDTSPRTGFSAYLDKGGRDWD